MFQDYGELKPGTQVSRKVYELEPDLVSDYVDAVQDENGLLEDDHGRELVPPMAVAALSIRGAVEDLRIPGGTLHAGTGVTIQPRRCRRYAAELRRHAGAKLGSGRLALSCRRLPCNRRRRLRGDDR